MKVGQSELLNKGCNSVKMSELLVHSPPTRIGWKATESITFPLKVLIVDKNLTVERIVTTWYMFLS